MGKGEVTSYNVIVIAAISDGLCHFYLLMLHVRVIGLNLFFRIYNQVLRLLIENDDY